MHVCLRKVLGHIQQLGLSFTDLISLKVQMELLYHNVAAELRSRMRMWENGLVEAEPVQNR